MSAVLSAHRRSQTAATIVSEWCVQTRSGVKGLSVAPRCGWDSRAPKSRKSGRRESIRKMAILLRKMAWRFILAKVWYGEIIPLDLP
jgi:hypothetical protein